jgi:hypothetical protein
MTDFREAEVQVIRAMGYYAAEELRLRGFVPAKQPQAQELSPTAKLVLWGAACRLLEENRSWVEEVIPDA